MTRWILPVLAVSPWLIAAAPGDVPSLDIESTCHVKGVGEKSAQDACMRDENGARTELVKAWGGIPPDTRRTCNDEVHIGGSPSYVELLTCAQMNEWSKNPSNTGAANGGIPPVKR